MRGDLIPVLACATGFVVGSIPFGLLVARMFNVRDLTQKGSGNIGTTNVSRVVGFWPAGFMTFALDVLKGIFPVFLAMPGGLALWAGVLGAEVPPYSFALAWAVGLFAVLGHCFSPWLRFRGGKGVATGFGVIIMLSPWAALGGIAAFAVAFLSKRIGSLASLSGLATAAILHLVLNPGGAYLAIGAVLIFVILIKHEPNIDALLQNRENQF